MVILSGRLKTHTNCALPIVLKLRHKARGAPDNHDPFGVPPAGGGRTMWGIVCKVLGHKRDGRRVKHDGDDLRTVCKRCGFPMKRMRTGGWVAEPSSADPSVR